MKLAALWRAWVALWDRREPATALALVRIGVGLVLLVDLVKLGHLGLVTPMFSAPPDGYAVTTGGWGQALFGSDPTAAFALTLAAVFAAVCIALGLATRVACIGFVLVSAQLAQIAPDADRGIHMVLRIVLVILALSWCHARWSIDAWVWRRFGRPLPTEVPAWPRYLILLQVIWIYVSAGMNKSGAEWGPLGDFRALANAVCDPHIARMSCDWVSSVVPLTQVATALSMTFELSAPLYLVYLYCAETADRAGRLRRLVNALRLRWVWLVLGIAFHVGIAVFLRLGAFPWGMLALYPALLLPRDLLRGRER
ncbi:MAG: HTTM domain-containing protein [Deltaproteobacteria bacterium]|nr:HTTM domain-containing protein [Deltaproteobacteria bacterium]